MSELGGGEQEKRGQEKLEDQEIKRVREGERDQAVSKREIGRKELLVDSTRLDRRSVSDGARLQLVVERGVCLRRRSRKRNRLSPFGIGCCRVV